jgi:hypothetical protein
MQALEVGAIPLLMRTQFPERDFLRRERLLHGHNYRLPAS